MNDENSHTYEDILLLTHVPSSKHPPMPITNRAAQFAPFAALTGHKEAVLESERVTQPRRILDDNKKALLDICLQDVVTKIKEHPKLKVTYFLEDERKEGGSYPTVIKALRRIDEYDHTLIFMDKSRIRIDDIYEIEYICE